MQSEFLVNTFDCYFFNPQNEIDVRGKSSGINMIEVKAD